MVLRSFGGALLGVILLGGLLGYGLSRGVHRRIVSISGTAEAIIDGDLTRRVPVKGDDDELDRLAATLNRMLDRIASLLDSLRQVSTDIAHDLRTPLTRLRHRLEGSLAASGIAERRAAVGAGRGDLDGILAVFAALLRISQIEAGARRAGLRSTDLTELARTVVDAFAPSAEDAGGSLTLKGDPSLVMEGDPELLTQMLVNMVENALRHAGTGGGWSRCAARRSAARPCAVIDDGPGSRIGTRTAVRSLPPPGGKPLHARKRAGPVARRRRGEAAWREGQSARREARPGGPASNFLPLAA